jgi:hypothetical protein
MYKTARNIPCKQGSADTCTNEKGYVENLYTHACNFVRITDILWCMGCLEFDVEELVVQDVFREFIIENLMGMTYIGCSLAYQLENVICYMIYEICIYTSVWLICYAPISTSSMRHATLSGSSSCSTKRHLVSINGVFGELPLNLTHSISTPQIRHRQMNSPLSRG